MTGEREITKRPAAPPLLGGTDALFLGLLLLLLIEYLGLGRALPPLGASRFSTFLAWGLSLAILLKVGGRAFFEYPQNRLLLGFVIFTGCTVLYTVVQMDAFTAFRAHVDYFGLFAVALYLVDRPSRVKRLSLAFGVISIVMVVRNVPQLTTSARQGVMEGAYFTGDGNDFAWALCTMLPFALYLMMKGQGPMSRAFGSASALACIFGVVGTQSRGAALSFAAMCLYYWFTLVRHKVVGVAAALIFAVGMLNIAPSYYVERLSTIESYQDDQSASSRLKMWGVAVRMAIDYPLGVGAGNFSVVYGLKYLPKEEANYNWGANRWLGAHSVYFRALGEYGVLGLLLVFWIVGLNFVTNERSYRLMAALPLPQTERLWPRVVNMSLVGYAVAGAFLGGLTYPHLYLISALTVSAQRMALQATAAVPVEAPPGAERPQRFAQLRPPLAPTLGARAAAGAPRARPLALKRPAVPVRIEGPR
jgi:probable O-glycosylation ligase (exosortase A-associated)